MERMMSTAPEMYDFCKSERTFNPSDRDFCTIMQEVEEDLLRVVHGDPEEYAAIPFCGSSAVCIDACVSSLVPEQGRILILNNGSSAARAAEAARNYHIDYSELRMPLDRPLDTGALELALQRDPRISAVYCCMHETDTGVLNPVKEIGSIAHRYNKVMIADVSSAFAILPIDVNEDCLDFLIGSAREGLASCTGLAFVLGKKDLLEMSKDCPARSGCCNLYQQYQAVQDLGKLGSLLPVQTVRDTWQGLQDYFLEGEFARWLRYRAKWDTLCRGLIRMGFQMAVPLVYQSHLVVSVLCPNNPRFSLPLLQEMLKARGYTIYSGSSPDSSVFRLSSLGEGCFNDAEGLSRALEESLEAMGVRLTGTSAENAVMGA